jgi:selenocysteine-specific elongation factor
VASASSDTPPLVLGTAGHIDHGKTALISVLTGTNTDRLPEERERGISIELGYAEFALPSGRRLAVVDVPGHERFVRTMVAGASGIDLFLLCVAADDGVMPQTREHLRVLDALGVSAGVVAITKADVADPARAAEEVGSLVPPGTPVVPVSAIARTGVDELVAALASVAATLRGRGADADPAAASAIRLHVDRSFTLRGIGTVVTGTLWSGEVGVGDRVTVLPGGLDARVRSVETFDEAVERIGPGRRVALNLVGPSWREIQRGDVVVAAASSLRPTYRLDVSSTVAVEPGTRLQVHHGTRDVPARIVPLGDEFVQLRLEQPLMALPRDRVVLRQLAPPDTLGGGVVVDAAPRRHGPSAEVVAELHALARNGAPAGGAAPGAHDGETATPPRPAPELDADDLRLAELLREDGDSPRTDSDLAEAAGLDSRGAADSFRRLEAAGLAVRTGANLHFHAEAITDLERRLVAIIEREGSATIATVRDELGTSRKYAQALLEHLDRTRVTLRRGDEHVLRRRR